MYAKENLGNFFKKKIEEVFSKKNKKVEEPVIAEHGVADCHTVIFIRNLDLYSSVFPIKDFAHKKTLNAYIFD